MTRYENVSIYIKNELERKYKVKVNIIRGLSTCSVEILFPYHETVWRFDYPSQKVIEGIPDETILVFGGRIECEWSRRVSNGFQ